MHKKSAPDMTIEVMATDWIKCLKHAKTKVHSRLFIGTQTHIFHCINSYT